MSEDFKNTQKKETGDFPAPSPDHLWNQLSNAVALVAKQDQIVWAVFGVFWAANAVLLVALFTTGKLPEQSVGIIVSGVGLALSLVWLAIEHRAVAWLRFYEGILTELERNHLHVPLSIAFTGHPEVVKGFRVRWLMLACPLISAALLGRCSVEVLMSLRNQPPPNKITAHNAGWPSQFRFAVNVFWSGVCEFGRWQISVGALHLL